MKLDSEQRKKANAMICWIVDDPEEAAFEIVGLCAALHKIAFEPFGPADATDKSVLDMITDFARATLDSVGGTRP